MNLNLAECNYYHFIKTEQINCLCCLGDDINAYFPYGFWEHSAFKKRTLTVQFILTLSDDQ